MEKDNKYTLSCENVKNIPIDKYEQNFTFIVNGKRYQTSRVKADLLSPVVSGYHLIDESIEEMNITTKGGEEKETQSEIDYFSDFIKLTDFSTKSIDENHRKHYIEYFYELGNINEYLRLQPEYFESLSPENVIDRLKFLYKLNVFKDESESMQEIVKYASTHFEEINKEEMKKLEPELLEEIIRNPSLRLNEEDSLIEFILELYKIDSKYSTLFEYVEFKNVNVDSLQKFIDLFDIELLNSQIWKRICQRLISSETSNETTDRYNVKYITREHEEGTEFNGLLRYLSDETGGNIHDNGTIEVTSNSIHSDGRHPKYLLDYQNTESISYNSNNTSDGYICFDFKDRKIQLTSYTIKSYAASSNNYHLKNWNIEVSDDKEHWIKIDEHTNDPTLNGSKIVAKFNIKNKTNFYQYVRLHQTGTNWRNDYYMIFYSLEMYGKLTEPKSTSTKTK